MWWCRRILQVMIATSRIRIELSKFVKQELHSLANYMHSNLTNQQVTKTITRHFASKVGFAWLVGEVDASLCTSQRFMLGPQSQLFHCHAKGYSQTMFPCLCSRRTVWRTARAWRAWR